MKKLYLIICFLILVLLVPPTYGMMCGMMDGHKDKKHTGQSGMMMQGQGMMGSMMKNMSHMTGMMQKMSDMMGKGMDTSNMRKMSEIMRDMSAQMMDMSRMMKKGNISQERMHELHQEMMDTQKRFEMMRME